MQFSQINLWEVSDDIQLFHLIVIDVFSPESMDFYRGFHVDMLADHNNNLLKQTH